MVLFSVDTNDEEIITRIADWETEGKLRVARADNPVVIDMQVVEQSLGRIASALEGLRKAGVDHSVMRFYIKGVTNASYGDIDAVLNGQMDFFRKLGLRVDK